MKVCFHLINNLIIFKKNGVLRKNRREWFENSYIPLHGVRGGQQLSKSYVINEWSLSSVLNDALVGFN